MSRAAEPTWAWLGPTPANPVRRAASFSAAAIMSLVPVLAMPAVAIAHQLRHRRSSNWAGYAITAGQPLESVSGRWVQPVADCAQQQHTYAAFWVGLGGFKPISKKLEQIGTEADCGAGGAKSYAWYELVPRGPVKVRLPIRPGDRIAAEVRLQGDLVRLKLTNLTIHRTFDRTIVFAGPDASSAEWITEAPSRCTAPDQCQTLPLTDFNTVKFTSGHAITATGHAGRLTNRAFTTTELSLSADTGLIGPTLPPSVLPPGSTPGGVYPASYTPLTVGARPTQLTRRGTGFAVNFTGNPTTTTTGTTTTTTGTTTTTTGTTTTTTGTTTTPTTPTTPGPDSASKRAALKQRITS